MASLIDLRRRIRSVKNTEQITKAMKMVSAAKLRRAQQAVVNARPYASLLEDMIGSVLARAEPEEGLLAHPLLARRECRSVQLLVLAGDKGLCGSFNSNVFKAARQFLAEREGLKVGLELLGRKAVGYYARRGLSISGTWEQAFGAGQGGVAAEIAAKAMRRFEASESDEVWMLFNRFQSVLKQETTLQRLLPVQPAAGGGAAGPEHECEQPPDELLGMLLPKHVETQVRAAMLDSVAAEHAARMTAMDAATRNAGEVLEKLTLHLNRMRQASITTEIIEIVSGAAALE